MHNFEREKKNRVVNIPVWNVMQLDSDITTCPMSFVIFKLDTLTSWAAWYLMDVWNGQYFSF